MNFVTPLSYQSQPPVVWYRMSIDVPYCMRAAACGASGGG